MVKKAFAALAVIAAAGLGFVGFAPQSSAQTIGGCANPDVCGFINASGFSIIGFANGTFGFITTQPPFFGAGTGPTITPTAAPAATRTSRLGQWGLGSLPVVPSQSALLANLPLNTRLANNAAATHDNGIDATTVVPVALGLMGLYGVLMVAVRRRATQGAVAA
ncbi:MAG: hypothetical protein QOJ00_1751 [Actinomycetota bacterium]|jgi:hypothetical protein